MFIEKGIVMNNMHLVTVLLLMGGTVHLRGSESSSTLQDNTSLEDVSATSQKIQTTPDETLTDGTVLTADEVPPCQHETMALPEKTAASEFITRFFRFGNPLF